MDTTKYIPKGLSIGDVAPDILANSIAGELINSKDISKEKEIVVLFYNVFRNYHEYFK